MTMYDLVWLDHYQHATNYAVFGHGFLGYSYGANFIKKPLETKGSWNLITLDSTTCFYFYFLFFCGFDPMVPWDSSPFFTRIRENSFVTLSKQSFTSKSKTKDPGQALRLSVLKPYSLWRTCARAFRQPFRNWMPHRRPSPEMRCFFSRAKREL